MTSPIDRLPPQQEALIPVYRQKWRNIALSTERIDRKKAAAAITNIYSLFCDSQPELIFCQSPIEAANQYLKEELYNTLVLEVDAIIPETHAAMYEYLDSGKINSNLRELIRDRIECEHIVPYSLEIYEEFFDRFGKKNRFYLRRCFLEPDVLASIALKSEITASVIQTKFPPDLWYDLIKNCGWTFPSEKICLVCDRPRVLRYDSDGIIHAEGKPAIEFTDGFSIYAYRGMRVPAKYGKLESSEWQPEWLLTETNTELRKILARGIGYEKICQKLPVNCLDRWGQCELLKIDSNVDSEPIYILAITSSSTGKIRIFPLRTAWETVREAIQWEIDPGFFIDET